jgi:PAS domain S-box-containing protein
MMNRYLLLLRRTSDAVVPFDRAGVIRYANQALETVFGHSPAEVLALLRNERQRGFPRPGLAA